MYSFVLWNTVRSVIFQVSESCLYFKPTHITEREGGEGWECEITFIKRIGRLWRGEGYIVDWALTYFSSGIPTNSFQRNASTNKIEYWSPFAVAIHQPILVKLTQQFIFLPPWWHLNNSPCVGRLSFYFFKLYSSNYYFYQIDNTSWTCDPTHRKRTSKYV